jgi:membrane protein DedA with SNARE-associated domain
LGAGLWNSFLLYIGWRWGQAGWDILMEYSRIFDIIVIVLLILAILWFIKKHLKKKS